MYLYIDLYICICTLYIYMGIYIYINVLIHILFFYGSPCLHYVSTKSIEFV